MARQPLARPGFSGRLSFLFALALAGCSANTEHAESAASAGGDGAYQGLTHGPDISIAGVDSTDEVRSITTHMTAQQSVASADAGPTTDSASTSAPAPPPRGRAPELLRTATDATQPGPILIYTASFLLSVYEVEKAQVALKAAVQQLGGFVSQQTDWVIILRVPADKFEAALSAVETTGKVRDRNVKALDVGDQYRDLNIRLSTAEAMRTRLEAMLARAEKVDEALRVEQELERVVGEIEQLKGKLRSLNDNIAFSTLAVQFQRESRPDIDDSNVFRLPYPWLDELGLHQLLELAP